MLMKKYCAGFSKQDFIPPDAKQEEKFNCLVSNKQCETDMSDELEIVRRRFTK